MKKTLYSLMLSEDVVHEIDLLAHRTGTNRSNLVNQILAEYVNLLTPERKIQNIFSEIEELLSSTSELIPFFCPNMMTMSLKSSLEYKYRPTVKYDVELYGPSENYLGELSVNFRTQSKPLINSMTKFFHLWKYVENNFSPIDNISYALYDGKFLRSISLPNKECTADELAKTISDYIKLFDILMKGYVSGKFSDNDIKIKYLEHLNNTSLYI